MHDENIDALPEPYDRCRASGAADPLRAEAQQRRHALRAPDLLRGPAARDGVSRLADDPAPRWSRTDGRLRRRGIGRRSALDRGGNGILHRA